MLTVIVVRMVDMGLIAGDPVKMLMGGVKVATPIPPVENLPRISHKGSEMKTVASHPLISLLGDDLWRMIVTN